MHAAELLCAWHGLPAWDEAAPVPFLAVLEPDMAGPPWTHVVTSAALTLQVANLVAHVREESVRASLQYALRCQGISRVVVFAEGRGCPGTFTLLALSAKAHALAGALRELEASPPPVDVAYWDAAEGALVAPGVQGWQGWRPGLSA